MNNIYLVSVNNDYPFSQEALHRYISQVLYPRYISNWWHYLPGPTYLVATTLNENQLYNLIIPHTGARYLLIIKVDPQHAQGWLPRAAWAWLGR